MPERNLFTISEDDNENEEFSVTEEEQQPQFIEKKEDEDWRSSKNPKHFVVFLFKEVNRLPRPATIRGNKSMLEKALGQYKQLDSYISQALRSDYDDEIDIKKVDDIRKVFDSYKDEVQNALDGIENMTKQKRHMRRHSEEEGSIVKEATTPPFKGIQVQMSAFERSIVGAIINGVVSGGKNIEEIYKNAKDKYKLSDREELAILQILADFGYPVFKDRLTLGDKDTDPSRKNNFGEWQSQYYA